MGLTRDLSDPIPRARLRRRGIPRANPKAVAPRSNVGFLARHPGGVIQALLFSLVAIITLQNVESTSIDVLFWSVPAFPKLVLIFVSMLAGAVAWELARRWIRR
jgi:uncharacterized integral membrane protein